MKTFLFDKICVPAIWVIFCAKFRHMFSQLTGYDLMFEASRHDFKPGRQIETHARGQIDSLTRLKWITAGAAKRALDKVQHSIGAGGNERSKTSVPGRA